MEFLHYLQENSRKAFSHFSLQQSQQTIARSWRVHKNDTHQIHYFLVVVKVPYTLSMLIYPLASFLPAVNTLSEKHMA